MNGKTGKPVHPCRFPYIQEKMARMSTYDKLLILFTLCPVWLIAQPGTTIPTTVVRADFHRLIEHEQVLPEAMFSLTVSDSLRIESGYFNAAQGERVPVLIYRPPHSEGRPLPVVICLHGTGGNKDQPEITGLLYRLSKIGFMAVAIDGRFHGGRAGGQPGANAYTAACIAAWENDNPSRQTHPFFFDTVYDVWRLVDYLCGRPDVDSLRIGLTGISKGGIETWMAAATDTRIKVVVPVIAVQSFRWSLDNDRWQGRAHTIWAAHQRAAIDLGDSAVNRANVKRLWDKLLPHITDEFDCPSMLRLIAPRPMLILNTELDANCPVRGAEIAYRAASAEYAARQAEDHLFMDIEPGQAHTFTARHREMMLEFFKKWL